MKGCGLEDIAAIAAALGTAWAGENHVVNGIVTDTRAVQPGDVFLALAGERFDAHEFLAEARRAGALAAIVSRPVDDPLPQLRVADTRLALGLLGQARRLAWGGPLVAVTGNSGKTTVKEMLAALLGRRGATLATVGNLNNDIGAPLTLLRLDGEHRQAVVELGANHLGEIAWTASLARPQVAVITNVTGAHVGEFGGMGQIAQAKAEILAGLDADGVAVLNRDDAFYPFWHRLAGTREILDFGVTSQARIHCVDLADDKNGRYSFTLVQDGVALGRVRLALLGLHNVRNALAAAAAALALGLPADDVIAGLDELEAMPGRMAPLRGIRGCRLLDDTYNANPGAMKAALEVLAQMPAPRWCFLGAMGELGKASDELHEDVGHHARRLGIDFLGTLGAAAEPAARAYGEPGCHFANWEALLRHAQNQLPSGASVLVKGSRSAGMERLIAALRAD
ncbi:UDP-N-acetylmuramoyl-tripeptide--D-alanyl-D-alanine ligase [Modicisalibacter ilicicola DSM 19980]|uniref:UDP-N-acetylmuramoyl-tripeptide--D-alanyl-D-alanine ligase n=1 Tax=Modicisalibacter ilicicola DSM 19980 TaxID=1121942 RepID=A0A1M5C676_9GAMM|nr:UDP-N-acetylmuramoyl-tripeptide--D-alanyl-D-alanine ligase [Halomonas ilicicola]SHF50146.1 UDP-N-acetylmuramoyl-tripeptide--D-alanyl-D-alanine ligase [Halomonas ilicicola DSM 19980]